VDAFGILDESSALSQLSSSSKLQLAGICIPKVLARREMLFHEGMRQRDVPARPGHHTALPDIRGWPGSGDQADEARRDVREAVLFERDDYPVSAIASCRPRCSSCDTAVHCLLEQPGFRREFIANLLAKQRYLADRVYRLAALDVETRFYSFLRDHWGEREEYESTSPSATSQPRSTRCRDALPHAAQAARRGHLQWEGARLRLRKGFWKEWGGS